MKKEEYWLNESKLKEPRHDEICFFVLSHWVAILGQFCPYFQVSYKEDITRSDHYVNQLRSSQAILEYAIPNKYVCGFIDVFVPLNDYRFYKLGKKEGPFREISSLLFEIKPTIKELGQIIRQISHYRKNLEEKPMVILVSETDLPEDKIKILLTQEIYYYRYVSQQIISNYPQNPTQEKVS